MKWEYKILSSDAKTDDELCQELNSLGSDEWELVEQLGQELFIFKRPASISLGRAYVNSSSLSATDRRAIEGTLRNID